MQWRRLLNARSLILPSNPPIIPQLMQPSQANALSENDYMEFSAVNGTEAVVRGKNITEQFRSGCNEHSH